MTVRNCSLHSLRSRDLFTEHFPTVKGKRYVHYNDRREKFVFQFHGTVQCILQVYRVFRSSDHGELSRKNPFDHVSLSEEETRDIKKELDDIDKFDV